MTKTIKSHIEIRASIEQVWQALMDIQAYDSWNPFMRIEGDMRKHRQIEVQVTLSPRKKMTFTPRVLEVGNHRLSWEGFFISPTFFTGTHTFYIKKISDKKVIFHQNETFEGLLVPLFSIKKTQEGFHAMNQALKEYVEGSTEK